MRHSSEQGGGTARGWRLALGLAALLAAGLLLTGAKASEWQTYLSDSFSEAKTAFPSGQFGEAFYTVDGGEYVIDGSKATQDSLSALTDNLYYYYAEAQCRVTGSSAGELAFSGLVFHYSKTLQKQRAYYVFYVYGDGYYGAKRVIGDDVVIVLPLARSTEIDPSGPNTLAVDAQGTRFDLYINGKYVNGFTDVRIDGGGFGFYVSKQTTAAFDNFKVKVERRGGGNEGAEFPASDGDSGLGRDTSKYPRLDVPKDPSRPTYPWEVGVDKSTRARKERRESGEEPEIDPQRLPGADGPAETDGGDGGSVDGPAGDPDPQRAGSTHPAAEAPPRHAPETVPEDAAPPEREEYIDPTPRLPAGEELAIPPSDKASDVSLGGGGAPATSSEERDPGPDTAGDAAQYTIWETPQEAAPAPPSPPAADDDAGVSLSELGQAASGADAKLPATARTSPAAGGAPASPRELTKAEKDAQFKAEKERKAREKEAKKQAERAERERREQEERDRKAQEAADREAARQARAAREADEKKTEPAPAENPAAPEPESEPEADEYREVANSMRRSWDDEPTVQSAQYDLPQHKSAPAAPTDAAARSAAQDPPAAEVIGEGVQLPALDSAQPAPEAAPAAPADRGLTPLPTREVQPGEPTAEEAAIEAQIPLYMGESGGDTVLLTPEATGEGGWVEAQPDSGQPEPASRPAAGASSIPLPPQVANPALGELETPADGPAAGPAEGADPFTGKPGLLRLRDDFSKPRWPESDSNGSRYHYAGGAYEIDNLAAQSMAISFQEERLGEIQLTSSATYLEGANYVGYGLAARFANGPQGISYYGFFVSQTGECLLLKVVDGQEQVLADWTASAAFLPAEANLLRLECVGGQLRGYVNGELAVQARDNSLAPGGYALLAGPGVSVRFDDLALVGLHPAGH